MRRRTYEPISFNGKYDMQFFHGHILHDTGFMVGLIFKVWKSPELLTNLCERAQTYRNRSKHVIMLNQFQPSVLDFSLILLALHIMLPRIFRCTLL